MFVRDKQKILRYSLCLGLLWIKSYCLVFLVVSKWKHSLNIVGWRAQLIWRNLNNLLLKFSLGSLIALFLGSISPSSSLIVFIHRRSSLWTAAENPLELRWKLDKLLAVTRTQTKLRQIVEGCHPKLKDCQRREGQNVHQQQKPCPLLAWRRVRYKEHQLSNAADRNNAKLLPLWFKLCVIDCFRWWCGLFPCSNLVCVF